MSPSVSLKSRNVARISEPYSIVAFVCLSKTAYAVDTSSALLLICSRARRSSTFLLAHLSSLLFFYCLSKYSEWIFYSRAVLISFSSTRLSFALLPFISSLICSASSSYGSVAIAGYLRAVSVSRSPDSLTSSIPLLLIVARLIGVTYVLLLLPLYLQNM